MRVMVTYDSCVWGIMSVMLVCSGAILVQSIYNAYLGYAMVV